MSNIDTEGLIIIIISLLITALFIMCIKCYYDKSKPNDFNKISEALNNCNMIDNERSRLI